MKEYEEMGDGLSMGAEAASHGRGLGAGYPGAVQTFWRCLFLQAVGRNKQEKIRKSAERKDLG